MPAINPCTVDGERLLQRLNADDEIAFVVSRDDTRWGAARTIERLDEGKLVLWHIPSGFPPLNAQGVEVDVLDPFAGWTDPNKWPDTTCGGANTSQPALLTLRIRFSERLTSPLVIADLEWIGGRYSVLGHKVDPAMKRWWDRFKRWFDKEAERTATFARP